LVDQVAKGLEEQIRSGQFGVGELLPSVQAMADTWQVSRTVMREALSRLSAGGLVHPHQGRGIFVAQSVPARKLDLSALTEDGNLVHIAQLRMALEPESAALAALNRKARDLKVMRSALERMRSEVETGDIAGGIAADIDFHRAICNATGNVHFHTLFVFLNQSFYRNISISRRHSAMSAGHSAQAQSEHQAIFDAVAAADPVAARSASRSHVANTVRRLGIELVDTCRAKKEP
jgi:GntR family transcriptional repressor for pyruvate dehydrogenase complex